MVSMANKDVSESPEFTPMSPEKPVKHVSFVDKLPTTTTTTTTVLEVRSRRRLLRRSASARTTTTTLRDPAIKSEPILVSYGSGHHGHRLRMQKAKSARQLQRGSRNLMEGIDEHSVLSHDDNDTPRISLRKSSMREVTTVRTSLLEKDATKEAEEMEEERVKKMTPFWTSNTAVGLYSFLAASFVSGRLWVLNGIVIYLTYYLFQIARKWIAFVTHDSQVQSLWHFVERCREHASQELEKTVHGGSGRRRKEAVMLVSNAVGAYYGIAYFNQRMYAMGQRFMQDHEQQIEEFRNH